MHIGCNFVRQDVFDTLAAAVGGREAGTAYEGDRRFDVVFRLNNAKRNDIEAPRQLLVLTPSGSFVPLGSIAVLELTKVSSRSAVKTANCAWLSCPMFVPGISSAW